MLLGANGQNIFSGDKSPTISVKYAVELGVISSEVQTGKRSAKVHRLGLGLRLKRISGGCEKPAKGTVVWPEFLRSGTD